MLICKHRAHSKVNKNVNTKIFHTKLKPKLCLIKDCIQYKSKQKNKQFENFTLINLKPTLLSIC